MTTEPLYDWNVGCCTSDGTGWFLDIYDANIEPRMLGLIAVRDSVVQIYAGGPEDLMAGFRKEVVQFAEEACSKLNQGLMNLTAVHRVAEVLRAQYKEVRFV